MANLDKYMVISIVGAICVVAIFQIPQEAAGIIKDAFLGLFGLATGYALSEVKNRLKNREDKGGEKL